MAYPEDYDSLTDFDLGKCSLYSHILTDGIIDTQYDIEMGTTYCIYANYGSGTPKVSIIDPSNDEFLIESIDGTYMENSELWKFCQYIPYSGGSGDGDTTWGEKSAILKLWSDESPLTFKKHVSIVTKACTAAEMCDTLDRAIDKIGDIQVSEAEQNEKIYTMANGITLRAIH